MELDSSTRYGKCRCCSSEGFHRDLWKEYCWNGIREVYSDIFAECYKIHLSTQPEFSSLICSSCVERLRDASAFRILVVSTEQRLLDTLGGTKESTVIVNIQYDKACNDCVKVECDGDSKVESWMLETSHQDWGNDSGNEMYEDHISTSSEENLIEGEAELHARFQCKPLPTRSKLQEICKGFFKHLQSLQGKEIIGKTLESLLNRNITNNKDVKNSNNIDRTVNKACILNPKKKRIQRTKYRDKEIDIEKEKNPYTVERLTHAANITALLEFSNLTAFKSKFQRAYPCFYCEKLFEDFQELRSHQNAIHSEENVNQCVLQKYRVGKPDGLVVYADVTDLKCKICNSDIPNINELKTHLTRTHQKKMYLELTDRVIPFKVKETEFQCQICGNMYETFGAVERHMNNHYRNYICDVCDSGFVTKQRLRIHGYLMHSKTSKKYTCDVCKKQFDSQQKRKIHVETVHENVKKYKCNRCPERFNEYFRRHKHMVLVHGVAPLEYKCNVCEKSFDRKYALSTHMRTHIQQKDVQCELCPYKCFTKVELRHHMVKHNGERIYECSVCKKSYAREKTLKEHTRIHTNDRRYVCPVCGQAFIQNCSLKSHIRSHHKEYGLM